MRYLLRSFVIWTLTCGFALSLAVRWIGLQLQGASRAQRQALVGRLLARLLRRLGATFIKLGQLLATRPDLLSDEARRELSQLHTRVGPVPYERTRPLLERELGAPPEQMFELFDPYPVASASVAQVHRALLQHRAVAVKVLRPGVEQQVDRDLRLMRGWARFLALIKPLRLLSPREVVAEFARAMRQQLDLRIEAHNNRRFAANFAHDSDVAVPGLVEQLCTRRVLVMDFIGGQPILEPDRPQPDNMRLARAGYRMLLKMVFTDGLVHADLHPGNLVVEDGRLVLLDVGVVAELTKRHRRGLVNLCLCWVAGDPRSVCHAIAETGFGGRPPADPERLIHDVERLMARYGHAALAEIEVGRLLLDVLRLVRGQWVRIDPAFTMLAVAIAVVEGVGRQLAPELKLMEEALPFFQREVSGLRTPAGGA